jgi:hypothetical protein
MVVAVKVILDKAIHKENSALQRRYFREGSL